jgi:hypothetical protein
MQIKSISTRFAGPAGAMVWPYVVRVVQSHVHILVITPVHAGFVLG